MRILALNGGSSSFKAGLFEFPQERAVWEDQAASLAPLLDRIPHGAIDAIGHRIVHGGSVFRETVRITGEVTQRLAAISPLDPQHNRTEIEGIDAAARVAGPEVPQYAVFDTAFHATLPAVAYTYPGPYEWLAQGIRRYGFHGISHQYVSRAAAEIVGAVRMITCHLGSGCSLAAIREGRSVDTTMGFTPLEGLMMATRSGSVDPGILIHLMRYRGHDADDLDRVLNRESGLKGISGISGDMREIAGAMEEGNERARLAFDLFVRRVSAGIAALVPSLGGLDALVFTGGIGENSAPVRGAVAGSLGFLGVKIDDAAAGPEITASGAGVRTLVVHTREELEIAREVSKRTR